jgi:hypothetical protein
MVRHESVGVLHLHLYHVMTPPGQGHLLCLLLVLDHNPVRPYPFAKQCPYLGLAEYTLPTTKGIDLYIWT